MIETLGGFLIGMVTSVIVFRWANAEHDERVRRSFRLLSQADEVNENLQDELKKYKRENVRLSIDLKDCRKQLQSAEARINITDTWIEDQKCQRLT